MTLDCINLETEFPTYRIRMSLDHERGHERDPWNFEIPCSRWKAVIFPHGGSVLQAQVKTRYVKTAMAALEGVGGKPWQVGDDEATVLFDVAAFDKIAAVLKPRRKRPAPSHFFGVKPAHKHGDEAQTGGSDEKDAETDGGLEK